MISTTIKNINADGAKIFCMVTPEHANLGDHAIACATYQILKDAGLYEHAVEISFNEYSEDKFMIIDKIKSNDYIIIMGGGNIGTLWPKVDSSILDIISTFKNNKILVFPESSFFSGEKMHERIASNRRIYESALDLTFFIREKSSYNSFSHYFPNAKCHLVPDVALYLSPNIPPQNRKNCLLCLRQDHEKVFSREDELIATLDEIEIKYRSISTLHERFIKRVERGMFVSNILTEFASSNLVITDRLHGMIFAALTGTPCLAFDNLNGKVGGVYEWIKTCGNIRMCTDVDDLIPNIQAYYKKINKYDATNLLPHFHPLLKAIEDLKAGIING